MPENDQPKSGAELLARIKPTLRVESTQICMRSDLLDAWAEAQSELAEVKTGDAASQRLGSGHSTETKKLAKKVQDLEKQIEDASIMFRFRAMPKDEWRALCDNHPPRKGNELDHYAGYNRDAVQDAAVRKCLFDPMFEDCAVKDCGHKDCGSWQAFVKVCNPGEWSELRKTVTEANQGVVGESPKSVLASRILSKRGSA